MLELRPVTPDDGPALHRVLAQPEVARWLRPAGVEGPFTGPECDRFIRRFLAHRSAHGFGTELAWEGGECIGWSMLEHALVGGRAELEIGWMVDGSRWGRGIGTRLGAAALDRAHTLKATGVVAVTRVDNARSRRVMEKLGLRHELDVEHAGLPHVLYREPGERPTLPTG